MADTVTTTLGLTKPEVGASEDSWGEKINTNFDLVDDALDGTTAVSLDINGGTIDGAVIGGATPAAITGTAITGTSFATSGDFTFGDNDKAIFGAGSDLQIYHDGFNSFISEQGTGNLKIIAQEFVVLNSANSEAIIRGFNDGAVELYYDAGKKLATTSTGIDVTGTVTADGLTVDGVNGLVLDTSGVTEASWTHNPANGESTISVGRNASWGGDLNINTDTLRRMRIQNNGDISFYEDTGTTPKFFWDASAESLGIGTSSPAATIDSSGADGGNHYSVRNWPIITNVSTTLDIGGISASQWSAMRLYTGGSPRMTIDSSGNVGIGTSSPVSKLSIQSPSGQNALLEIAANGNTLGSTSALYGQDAVGNAYAWQRLNGPLLFGTNNSERMRIDSSGNVGIGTTTPNAKITLKRSGAGLLANGDDGTVVALIADTTGSVLTYGTYTSHPVTFKTANGERMRIDSSGNVGIGVTPSRRFHVVDTSGGNVALFSNNVDADLNINLTSGVTSLTPSTGILAFGTTNAERMRIDSSGNLLVGTTSAYGTTGTTINAAGLVYSSADADRAGQFDRTTSDGELVRFSKAGTTVGSIGYESSGLYIDGEDSHAGLSFGGNSVVPRDGGARLDNVVDVGSATYRFKDLYLSSGVYLGGTGSANKLDDYEEGTWTPTFGADGANPTVTYNTQIGRYTKVGNLVTVYCQLITTSRSGGSGTLTVDGLPFTVSSSMAYASATIGFNYNWNTPPLNAGAQSNTIRLILYQDGRTNAVSGSEDILASGNTYFYFMCSYETNS